MKSSILSKKIGLNIYPQDEPRTSQEQILFSFMLTNVLVIDDQDRKKIPPWAGLTNIEVSKKDVQPPQISLEKPSIKKERSGIDSLGIYE